MSDSIQAHDESATIYDQAARDYEWHGHEIIFGLCYEYLKPKASLLDVGIGTGLSSEYFSQNGISVTGLDGSKEMLKQCEQKQFATKLIHHDITKTPWPFEDHSFDWVLSIGVCHFLSDIEPFLAEIARVTKPGGIVALQILDPNDAPGKQHLQPVKQAMDDHEIFAHPLSFIFDELGRHGFIKLKQVGFLAKHSPESSEEFLCRAILATKQ